MSSTEVRCPVDCNFCGKTLMTVPAIFEHLRDEHPDVWDRDPSLAAAASEWLPD